MPPIVPLIAAGAGLVQAFAGGGGAKKAERQLEKMIDAYQPNRGILDYYNKALQRYSANPYSSSLFNYQQEQIKGGTAQGIQALGDRRSTLAGLPSLIQGQNDAMLKAGAAAEGQQAQALGQLGQAASMKADEDKYKFEAKYNLLAQKAGAKNMLANAGFSNIFGALQDYGNLSALDKIYGGKKK